MFSRLPFDPAETLEKAKAGDKDALSRLWSLLNPGLVRYLSSLRCKFSEDIASETWISLARVLPRFQGNISSLQGLLFQIARARLYDQLRKDYKQPKAILMIVDETMEYEMLRTSPEVELDDGSSQIVKWLSLIPTTQAEVVSLRVIVGLSHFEISQVIGKSEGAVRILFFRGLENLQKVITSENKSKIGNKFSSSA